ncbi:MAG TPA: cysteine rich repeat-containing protein [Pseudomonadales bacterium]|nr:cysteine rich repeat-containing protein [Pseudomonadales bacterium]
MFRVVASIVFCACLTGAAAAAESEGQRPCKADMEKYCADARGDRAKMGDCMKTHFNDFSSACQARIKERQEHQGNGGPMSPQGHPAGGAQTQGTPQT